MLVDVAEGDMNVRAPGLLRTRSGKLLMNCLRAHKSGGSSTMCFFISSDDGKTFTEEEPLWKVSKGQLLQGGGNMPAYGKHLSPPEVSAIVSFLGTLHPSTEPAARNSAQPATPR